MRKKLIRLVSMLMVLTMTAGMLAGCGSKGDADNEDYYGVYEAMYGSISGITINVEDVYDGGFTIELKKKGKAVINVDGTEAKGKWTLDDEDFTFSGGGFDCEGTLEDGVITLEDVMSSGLELILVNKDYDDLPKDILNRGKEDEDSDGSGFSLGSLFGKDDEEWSEEENSVPDVTVKEKWEGTWFGWINFEDGRGGFDVLTGAKYAAYMVLDFTEDEAGDFIVYAGGDELITGKFEIINDRLYGTEGLFMDIPINPENWAFEDEDGYEHKITMEDRVADSGDEVTFTMYLKPWGVAWDEMDGTDMYEPIFSPYAQLVEMGEEPKFGWANPLYDPHNAPSNGEWIPADGDDEGNDGDDASATGGVDAPAVSADNYTIVDNEYVKIVAKGVGANPYNDSWIGYKLTITNKCDYSLCITSCCEPFVEERIGGGNLCFFKGKETATHFSEVIKAGMEADCVLAVDGVTSEGQLEDVSGYLSVTNNEASDLGIIGNYPYHFK